ncbi:cupredoxin domain-containing protein [Phycicoccus sp. Soil803]|uniref:cupredoxin domain-containing protein n=1 Tax=Phycicoccus sp. Soil803 TaxID=1736415 RepID=UPI000B1880A0
MTLRRPMTCAAGLALSLPLALGLAACGSSGDDSGTGGSTSSSTTSSSSSSSGSSSSSSSSSASGRTIAITVTGSKVTPAPATVDLAVGEQLTLTVTSDHADQLHIHGFEIEKDLVAGTPLSVTVTGAQPGVYEVETHHPELRLMKIAVR